MVETLNTLSEGCTFLVAFEDSIAWTRKVFRVIAYYSQSEVHRKKKKPRELNSKSLRHNLPRWSCNCFRRKRSTKLKRKNPLQLLVNTWCKVFRVIVLRKNRLQPFNKVSMCDEQLQSYYNRHLGQVRKPIYKVYDWPFTSEPNWYPSLERLSELSTDQTNDHHLKRIKNNEH